MAQVKFLKISADGVPIEHSGTTDSVTLQSFTVSGGPIFDVLGADMNTTSIKQVVNIDFSDPAVGAINGIIANDLMGQAKDNTMSTAGSVLFPVITDSAGQVDALRLPALAGIPTATPTASGEGFLVWDSAGDAAYAWDGAKWVRVNSNTEVDDFYTAGEAIALGDLVYISAADTVMKADAGAVATSYTIGFAAASASLGAQVPVRSAGIALGLTGRTAGARQYLSGTVAGAVIETPPTATGNTVVQAGYAKNTTDVHVQILQLGRRA